MKLGHHQILKSLLQLVLGLLIFALIIFLFMRWQASGYQKYVFHVHAHDTAVFTKTLNASDPRIRKFGRILKDGAMALDKQVDDGDGAKLGKVRWYLCRGIDCDEGWEHHFDSSQ